MPQLANDTFSVDLRGEDDFSSIFDVTVVRVTDVGIFDEVSGDPINSMTFSLVGGFFPFTSLQINGPANSNNTIDASGVTGANFSDGEGRIILTSQNGDDTLIGSTSVITFLSGFTGNNTLINGIVSTALVGDIIISENEIRAIDPFGNESVNTIENILTLQLTSIGAEVELIDVRGFVSSGLLFEEASPEGFAIALEIDALSGNSETIFGLDDDTLLFDFIVAGAGNDVVFAAAGNDVIDGGAGDDRIDGGTGNDLIFDPSGLNFLNGGIGDDNILGGSDSNTIIGGLGFDFLQGGIGNDVIRVGELDSSLELDPEAERNEVLALSGDDLVFGGIGNDTINAGLGNDRVFGEGGNDQILLSIFTDVALLDEFSEGFGGLGNDTILGGDGIELIRGQGDNDLLDGGIGRDSLFGGSGNDTLVGFDRDAILSAGSGNDFIIDDFDAADRIEGGLGEDTLSIVGDFESYTLTRDTLDRTLNGEVLTTSFSGIENIELQGFNNNNSITFDVREFARELALVGGLEDDDFIVSGRGNTTVFGLTGEDTLTNEINQDRILDNFQIQVGNNNLITHNSIERFELIGGGNGNVLDASDFSLTGVILSGLGGQDTLSGGSQDDLLIGGSNIDTVKRIGTGDVVVSNTTFQVGDVSDVDVDDLQEIPSDIALTEIDEKDTLSSIERLDIQVEGSVGAIIDVTEFNLGNSGLTGGNGGDLLISNAGRDTLIGGGGDDTLSGGALNDEFIGGAGTDRLIEKADVNFEVLSVVNFATSDPSSAGLNETILFGLGTDSLSGLEELYLNGGASSNRINVASFDGVSFLRGFGGNDTLVGTNGGADTIQGGNDDDFLGGRDGDDELDGGDGIDVIIGSRGADNITGGMGDDRLFGASDRTTQVSDFLDEANSGVVLIEQLDTIMFFNIGGGGDRQAINTIAGEEGDDIVVGGGGDDVLFGDFVIFDLSDSSSDTIGNDTLFGGNGKDSIYGGLGDDSIFGEQGNDTIFAGNGLNTAFGGRGDDLLFGGDQTDDLFGGSGSDMLFGGGGNDRLVADTVDDFLFPGGNDILNGGAGNDMLEALGVNFTESSRQGRDILTGGADRDEFILRATTSVSGSFYDGQEVAVITDFTIGEDTVVLTQGRQSDFRLTEAILDGGRPYLALTYQRSFSGVGIFPGFEFPVGLDLGEVVIAFFDGLDSQSGLDLASNQFRFGD
ncbi:calcium-binding protein [Synechococcus sp. PCC 7336]|uniref:calcium-binding protein n=1 Tax=Synechococcus sp. PCC 7336 TaxID=195250 RepID=UPI00034969BB|nr:calcium-binding protein [Synechococcus sp. PCC 7336]